MRHALILSSSEQGARNQRVGLEAQGEELECDCVRRAHSTNQVARSMRPVADLQKECASECQDLEPPQDPGHPFLCNLLRIPHFRLVRISFCNQFLLPYVADPISAPLSVATADRRSAGTEISIIPSEFSSVRRSRARSDTRI